MMETFIGRPSTYTSSSSCPGNDCRFDNFTSLGVHAVCEDPEAVQINDEFGCTYYTSSNTTGTRQNYTQIAPFREAVERDLGRNLSTYGMDCFQPKEGFPTFTINMNVDASTGGYTLEPITTETNVTSSLAHPPAQTNEGLFGVSSGYRIIGENYLQVTNYGNRKNARFCLSSFNRIYGGNSPSNGTFDTIGAFTCFERTYNPNITDLAAFGYINATLTYCRVNFCAQEFRDVRISNNTLAIGSFNEVALQKVGDGPYGEAVATSVDDPSKRFIIGPKAFTPMVELVRTVLYSNDFAEFVAFRQNYTDWRNVFTPLASSMSEFMRTPEMNNFVRRIVGQVYVKQPYFDVTWGWIVMPLLMVAMSIGFLVATAVHNRNKPYLFKTSVLAPMKYGVEEWDKKVLSAGNRETDVDLGKAAEGMRVRFVSGDDGLKLVKEDS